MLFIIAVLNLFDFNLKTKKPKNQKTKRQKGNNLYILYAMEILYRKSVVLHT
jgi:hypothetical protein